MSGLDSDVMGTPGAGGHIGHMRFNKCGWIEVGPDEDGITRRIPFSQLYGDINFVYGKPVHVKGRSYLRKVNKRRGFEVSKYPIGVGYVSTANLNASKRAVDRLNATLNSLSKIATGQTIQSYSGAEQAASVRKTQARVGAVVSTVAAIAASGAAQTPATTSTGNTSGSTSAAQSSNSKQSTNTGTTSGIAKIENWGKSPDGSSAQYKITCTNGTSHRYWRQSGEWYGPFGSAGFKNYSINDLAQKRCG